MPQSQLLLFRLCQHARNEDVLIPSVIRGKRVVEIGKEAFVDNRKIVRVTIPHGVVEIGERAFSSCWNLEEILIPKGITEIRPYTFQYCNKLHRIVIPNGVKSIGDFSFFRCESLVDIAIPASVAVIDKNAFMDRTIDFFYRPNRAFTIHCSRGSYAEQYARKHKFRVEYTG